MLSLRSVGRTLAVVPLLDPMLGADPDPLAVCLDRDVAVQVCAQDEIVVEAVEDVGGWVAEGVRGTDGDDVDRGVGSAQEGGGRRRAGAVVRDLERVAVKISYPGQRLRLYQPPARSVATKIPASAATSAVLSVGGHLRKDEWLNR